MTTKKELQEKVAELQAKVDAMEDDVWRGNGFLFYPEDNEMYITTYQANDGDYGYASDSSSRAYYDSDYKFPKYKDFKRAERVAWGRGQMDIWKAMGDDLLDGRKQFSIDSRGEAEGWTSSQFKALYCDALFPTGKEARQALKEFGGIEKLKDARLAAQWGV